MENYPIRINWFDDTSIAALSTAVNNMSRVQAASQASNVRIVKVPVQMGRPSSVGTGVIAGATINNRMHFFARREAERKLLVINRLTSGKLPIPDDTKVYGYINKDRIRLPRETLNTPFGQKLLSEIEKGNVPMTIRREKSGDIVVKNIRALEKAYESYTGNYKAAEVIGNNTTLTKTPQIQPQNFLQKTQDVRRIESQTKNLERKGFYKWSPESSARKLDPQRPVSIRQLSNTSPFTTPSPQMSVQSHIESKMAELTKGGAVPPMSEVIKSLQLGADQISKNYDLIKKLMNKTKNTGGL